MNKLTTKQTIAIIIAGMGFSVALFLGLGRNISPSEIPKEIPKEIPTIITTESTSEIVPKDIPNISKVIVLLGNDYRSDSPDRYEDTQQTDAFLIVHIEGNKITVFNIARELYVPIIWEEGTTSKIQIKVSQLYSADLLGFTNYNLINFYVYNIFGLYPDAVFAMNMDGFLLMMESLGDIQLTATRYSKDKCDGEWVEYIEGTTYVLDAPQALCYARMRFYSPNGYFDRQERQFDVLVALAEGIKNKIWDDPIKGVQALSHIDEFMDTNLDLLELGELVGEGLEIYNGEYEIRFVSMDLEILELYPRETDKSPYLYYATVDLKEWILENIGK